MTDLVRQKFKINISGKKVLKLMKENALLSTVRRKRFTPEEYNRMRKNKEEVPENLLKRNFFALESDKKYVSDLTYLFGKECVKYLSLIEDLFNAEIVAWKISDHPDEQLCEETLDLLAAERNLEGAIFHTYKAKKVNKFFPKYDYSCFLLKKTFFREKNIDLQFF